MAWRDKTDREGSWTLAEHLLATGDSAFVDELRSIHDPDRLGKFAARWLADKRPEARRLLLEYLDLPLNAYRHEPLVKRLFKAAEAAGDDVVMARMLLAFDRSVRRTCKRRRRYSQASGQIWTEETIAVPRGTTMPRSDRELRSHGAESRESLCLFSVHTRDYLRRRAWRYFRWLGAQDPSRYLAAALEALWRYTDDDVADGLELLDNWGLMHILFHECPAIVARASGWALVPGHTLEELAPAPAFAAHWQASGAPLVNVLLAARCRPVRQWAIQMLQRHFPDALMQVPLAQLVELVGHEDPALAALAAEGLRKAPALASLSTEQWLALLDTANPQTLDVMCELMIERLDRSVIALAEAIRLAASRPLSVARLGLALLRGKQPANRDDCRTILTLSEAEAAPIRSDLVRWARSVLSASADFETAWVLELLDSRHEDVRAEGWAWFQDEPRARHDVTLWRSVLETPYDDLRLKLVGVLEDVVCRGTALPIDQGQLAPELIRFLWASVLLNVQRGNRAKPFVVRQMARRLERHPEDAGQLLPIFAVALRSVRGPEWRAGLAGVVQLVERCPTIEPGVRGAFPELQLPVNGGR
jgi:hypothetical protein